MIVKARRREGTHDGLDMKKQKLSREQSPNPLICAMMKGTAVIHERLMVFDRANRISIKTAAAKTFFRFRLCKLHACI